MFFTTLVLISVYCEHDSLEQSIDLSHCDEPAEMCDMARLGLEEEEEVPVFLCFLVIRKETFLDLCSIFQMACNFVLLLPVSN